MAMEHWWNDNWRRWGEVLGQKSFPLPFGLPEIPHGPAWAEYHINFTEIRYKNMTWVWVLRCRFMSRGVWSELRNETHVSWAPGGGREGGWGIYLADGILVTHEVRIRTYSCVFWKPLLRISAPIRLSQLQFFDFTKSPQAAGEIVLRIWSGPFPSVSLLFDYTLTGHPSLHGLIWVTQCLV